MEKKILINSYKQLSQNESIYYRTRKYLKKKIISNKYFHRKSKNTIQYIYYHHVFEDEKNFFIEQIKYLKSIGQFISYDDGLKVLNSEKISERFFVLSFDDGFKNNLEVIDILEKFNIPATFFIPVSFIGNQREDSGEVFFFNNNFSINFMTWNDCIKINNNNLFSLESHTINHLNLNEISISEVYSELSNSRSVIYEKIKYLPKHFCCPYGKFNNSRHLDIAKEVGYSTFSTSIRGNMMNNKNPFLIKRHHLESHWDKNFLKFFLG